MPTDKQNSSWLSVQFVITLIFSLLTIKLNLSHFGENTFGIWILLASIWGFGAIIDFGFNTTIVKYVAEFKNEFGKVNRLLSTSFYVFVANGLLILVLGSTVGYFAYFRNTAIISEESHAFYLRIFAILGLSFYLQYLSLFFKAVMEGLNNFILSSKMTILQNTLILAGTIIISITSQSLTFLSILYAVTYLIIISVYYFHFRFKIVSYSISIALFDFKEVKRIIGFSLSVQAMTVFNSVIDPIVKYMIGTYLDIKIVPAYEIARRFALAVSGLFFNAFKIVLPKASVLRSLPEIKKFISDDLIKFIKIGITYSGAAFGISAIAIVFIIKTAFGIADAVVIFMILALPESINNFGYSIYNFLLGQGKVRILVIIQLTNLIFVLIGLFAGFTLFHNLLGLLGYFISVLIGNVLMVLYLKSRYSVTMKEFLLRSKIYKLGLLLILLIGSMFIIQQNVFPVYMIFTLQSIISLLLFYNDLQEYYSIVKSDLIGYFKN